MEVFDWRTINRQVIDLSTRSYSRVSVMRAVSKLASNYVEFARDSFDNFPVTNKTQ